MSEHDEWMGNIKGWLDDPLATDWASRATVRDLVDWIEAQAALIADLEADNYRLRNPPELRAALTAGGES